MFAPRTFGVCFVMTVEGRTDLSLPLEIIDGKTASNVLFDFFMCVSAKSTFINIDKIFDVKFITINEKIIINITNK